jgi:Glyoxalase-like domain
MYIDHVLLSAGDDAPTSLLLTTRYGLHAYEGGRHPGWGTANRIIPLGDAYLELVSVVDEAEARASAFGRWALESAERGRPAIGWAVRPDDLDVTATRLGLEISEGSRTRPSGEIVAWRSAGVDEVARRPWLPFFIEWRDVSTHPGRSAPSSARLERIDLECDVAELDGWLGPHALPVDVRAGDAGIVRIVVETPAGRVVLGRGSAEV